ncbi:ATP-dependent DNA helicase [Enterococcus sp. LJL98]
MKRGKIAVRHLVEFVLRQGNIDNRRTSNHTAQEGARIHRKLQKEAGDSYQPEVFLKMTYEIEEEMFSVEGRADGVFHAENCWTIDEIKTSALPFEELDQGQKELFFAQGMVYAYLYATLEKQGEMRVQLTYFQTTEEKIRREIRSFTYEELESFFKDLINEYQRWLIFQDNWRRVRNTSLLQLQFPYTKYRKGQRELAVVAYKTLKTKQKLFAEAPTGTGKTISTLFPALKALGEDSTNRIFYLTAKTITRSVVEDAMETLANHGAQAKSVTLTAKDKICFLEERRCNPDDCPYARGYYDRINVALWDILHHETQITRAVIEKYGKKHQVCPFELSLDVSLFCDLIIADYNYLFDPIVYLKRFFEADEESYYFLIDEAHNLVGRSREMYSAALSDSIFVELQKRLPKQKRKIQGLLANILSEFDLLKDASEKELWTYKHQVFAPEKLTHLLFQLTEHLQMYFVEHEDGEDKEQILVHYFECIRFLKMSEYYDDSYETTIEIGYHQITIKLFCIDPSSFLEDTLNKGESCLLFSASLNPMSFYQKTLGGGNTALTYRVQSPFPIENQGVFVVNYIQTTFRKRQESLMELVETLFMMVSGKTGNYFVFFSSYHYLDQVLSAFKEKYPLIETLVQETKMDESERERFLAQFVEHPEKTLVGFCVLGGIFSEGIDLKGDRLIGTAIVGVGLPQINHEQELIKAYFSKKNNQGFEYAYQLPGMNKVLQAAGRVIRDMDDQGIVLLIDSRFTHSRYRQLFPAHWQHAKICLHKEQVQTQISDFWHQRSKTKK